MAKFGKNEPRTAKVGAISKAQNCKRGDPSGFVKLQLVANYEKKIENEIFEQCHSAEKCKRGGPLGFFDIHCVAKCRKKMNGRPFVQSKKFLKVPKKVGLWGILSVISMFRTSVLFLLFVLDALLRFELLRFEVVKV